MVSILGFALYGNRGNGWGAQPWSMTSCHGNPFRIIGFFEGKPLVAGGSPWPLTTQHGPIWGPTGSWRPQMGPMWAPWTLLSGQWYGALCFICCYLNRLLYMWRIWSLPDILKPLFRFQHRIILSRHIFFDENIPPLWTRPGSDMAICFDILLENSHQLKSLAYSLHPLKPDQSQCLATSQYQVTSYEMVWSIYATSNYEGVSYTPEEK